MAAAPSPQSNGWSNRDYSPRRQQRGIQQGSIELEHAFKELRIRDAEIERLRDFQRRLQNEEAELKENSLAKIHHDALEKARQNRDSLRLQAEAVLQRHLREEEERRRQREEEERQRLEREIELKAARERARREEEKRRLLEQDRIRAEAEAKAAAERERQEKIKTDTERLEREKRNEEQRQQQQAREKKEHEENAKAEAAKEADRKAREAQAAASASTSQSASASNVSAEQTHLEYLALYLKLKKWNNDYWEKLKQASKPANKKYIKEAASAARGVAKTEVGKLSYGDAAINRLAANKITECLTQMLASTTPEIGEQIPVNFFLPPSLSLNDNDQTTISDHAAYFIYNLAKQIVKIFCTYVTGVPERAEPIGTMVTKIFGNASIQFTRHGDDLPASMRLQSLFPILLAKYHKVCPALFGITAPQDTPNGKLKMGWALSPSPDDSPKNQFVDEARHYDRVSGVAIGFAAIALRNASTVKLDNPYPPKHFWASLAQLVNLPPAQVQPTHLCVLRNMFGHEGVKRFLLFYGDVGIALLREAFVEFPKRLPPTMMQNTFYKELLVYVEQLQTNEPLHLT